MEERKKRGEGVEGRTFAHCWIWKTWNLKCEIPKSFLCVCVSVCECVCVFMYKMSGRIKRTFQSANSTAVNSRIPFKVIWWRVCEWKIGRISIEILKRSNNPDILNVSTLKIVLTPLLHVLRVSMNCICALANVPDLQVFLGHQISQGRAADVREPLWLAKNYRHVKEDWLHIVNFKLERWV